jgi:glycosyltransferase involved in cell wall biosynthesis
MDAYASELGAKIHVIYPLIDIEQFALRKRPPAGPLTILSNGRLTEYKGFPYLIEACRILQEQGVSFVCQIIGQGEDRAKMEAAVARYRLDDRVRLLGTVPNSEVAALLEQATVFALPCVIARNGDRDGMPLVLIEAMARGVPVVSSDVIGLRELVREGVGYLVPPRDPAALADALMRVDRAGPEAQTAMGLAGRKIVEEELEARSSAAKLAALFTASIEAGEASMASVPDRVVG